MLLRELLRAELGPDADGINRRRKRGFPASGIGLAAGFSRYCDSVVSDDRVRDHPLGTVLGAKYLLVMYDLFEELAIRGRFGDHAGFDLGEFVLSRYGSRTRVGRAM